MVTALAIVSSSVAAEDQQHWSFRRLARPRPPVENSAVVVGTPVDAFINRRLHEAGLGFPPPADAATLLRRVYLDLHGIPPSTAEQDRFLADRRPDAWPRLIDRLLASPRFGERWGRHWLDVAGYADTVGFDHVPTQVVTTRGKWRYRDYVIESINTDVGFDRFLREQLAGDEMVEWKNAERYTPELVRHLVATGFLRTARDQTHEGVGVIPPNYYEVLFDTVDLVAAGLLGLSVKCARCHDHKFDEIPQRDYYRLMAVLMPAYNPTDWRPVFPFDKKVNDRSLPDATEITRNEIARENAELDRQVSGHRSRIDTLRSTIRGRVLSEKARQVPEPIRADVLAAVAADAKQRNEIQKYLAGRFEKLLAVSDAEITEKLAADERRVIETERRAIAVIESRRRRVGRIQALFDVGQVPKTFVLTGGQHGKPGQPVEPGYLGVLCDSAEQAVMRPSRAANGSSGRRLALARWLTAPDTRASALVSRVLVNRAWQALFGRGLVATSGDFGVQGLPPSHPELLEWLCRHFQAHGWQLKPLLRVILNSHTYRQASRATRDRATRGRDVDPSNRLLWRMPLRRLESESIRDCLLAVSGRLDSSIGGPPVPQQAHADGRITIHTDQLKRPFDRRRRSVYLLARRGYSLTLLDVFDQPSIQTTCSRRQSSAVPLQSLTMLNGRFVDDQAEALAERIGLTGGDVEPSVRRLYRVVLCRLPDAAELQLCRETFEVQAAVLRGQGQKPAAARRQALKELCHTLLNTSEFLYRE